MKITDITVRKEANDGDTALVCQVTLADGSTMGSALQWRNTRGLWASNSDEREPAEIAAFLRVFADAIDRSAGKAKAA